MNDRGAYSISGLDGEELAAGFAVQETIKHAHARWRLGIIAAGPKD
jgi:hypothetical protein